MFMEISDAEMLSKYLRKSRALGLFWIPRRGVAWIYSFKIKTSADAQRVAEVKKKIYKNEFPYPDLIVRFKDVPPHDQEWKIYKKRKDGFMKEERESRMVRRAREKIEKKLDGSMTLRDIATVYNIQPQTARKWAIGNKNNKPLISKSHIFKDFGGRVRISKKGVRILDKNIKKKRKF